YAARKGRYVIVDGFSHTTPQVFDSLYFSYDIVKRESSPDSHDFIPNVFHLYKLHGSVDWTKSKSSGEIEKDPTSESPLLIYPRNTKYELSFEQPYLEMMSAFQTALRQPDTGLLVLGFGFNDNHLAEPILSAINSNLHLKVVVCDPGLGPWENKDKVLQDGNDAKHPYLSKLRYLIEHGDARLALISSTFEQAVPLMPDIAAETDLEQHYERIRLMREAG
ncbi:MAG: SIR2 family protein, partial [Hydrogenophaga sp.]